MQKSRTLRRPHISSRFHFECASSCCLLAQTCSEADNCSSTTGEPCWAAFLITFLIGFQENKQKRSLCSAFMSSNTNDFHYLGTAWGDDYLCLNSFFYFQPKTEQHPAVAALSVFPVVAFLAEKMERKETEFDVGGGSVPSWWQQHQSKPLISSN